MSKLSDDFNRYEKALETKQEVEQLIKNFERDNKDNEVLKQYLKLLKKLEKAEKEIDSGKTYLYEGMMSEEIDMLNGAICDISLKKPYDKTNIDTKKFLLDNKPGSKLYEKYASVKEVKGNIIVKMIKD